MVDSMQRDFIYREKLWSHLVGGTPETMQHEIGVFEREKFANYRPPLKPWVSSLLGRSYIFRTRTAGIEPDLISSLMFVSDVMHLHLMETNEEGSIEQHHVQTLIAELAKQDPEGPWADTGMTSDSSMMDALSAIISHIHVFLPNNLLTAHNVTVSSLCSSSSCMFVLRVAVKCVNLCATLHAHILGRLGGISEQGFPAHM